MRAVPRAASACRSKLLAGGLLASARSHGCSLCFGATVQRLKTRAQFQAVMAGATVSRTAHFALHRIALPAPLTEEQALACALFPADDCWIGAILPKRWARRAVTRNAIRRQIYAVCSEGATGLPAAAHVIRLRSGFDRKQFISATSVQLKQAVRSELQQLVRKAGA